MSSPREEALEYIRTRNDRGELARLFPIRESWREAVSELTMQRAIIFVRGRKAEGYRLANAKALGGGWR